MAAFVYLWEEATVVFGWATLGEELVQVRGGEEGWLRKRKVLLLKGERADDLAAVWSLPEANAAVVAGWLRSDMAEVDELSSGTRVSTVLGDDILAVYRTNGAHAGIILDRIAAGELYPSDDLLRCLRATPATAERLGTMDLEELRRRAGPGRIPTEEERLARLRPVLMRQNVQKAAVRFFDNGLDDKGMELMDEVLRMTQEAQERREREFGGPSAASSPET